MRPISLVLALSVSSRRYKHFPAAVKSAVLLNMTVTIASNMHFIALSGLTQHCLILHVWHSISMASRHSTRLCTSVHPWERVSEIQSIKKMTDPDFMGIPSFISGLFDYVS